METLSKEQVKKAVHSLCRHYKGNCSSTISQAQCHGQDEEEESSVGTKKSLGGAGVYLVIGMKKIPEKSPKLKPVIIPLLHSLQAASAPRICLFVKDPGTVIKRVLEEGQINDIDKVIGVGKLRKNYKPFEARRILSSSYDLFLADERVIPMLPGLLGKAFLKKKIYPLPIDCAELTKVSPEAHSASKSSKQTGNESLSKSFIKRRQKAIDKFKTRVSKLIGSTSFVMKCGPCISIKLGTLHMEEAHVVENVMDALPSILAHIPKQWKNIQSLHIKTSDSVALPVYHCAIEEDTTIST